MAKIHTPVKDYNGIVVGVQFNKGEGETTDAGAIQYFERHGYKVEHDDKQEPLTQPAKSANKAEWEAYALQEGKDIDGLTADQIKALFIQETPQAPEGQQEGDGGKPADPENPDKQDKTEK